jgi:hypothetical protein
MFATQEESVLAHQGLFASLLQQLSAWRSRQSPQWQISLLALFKLFDLIGMAVSAA